jgi:NAD-dependent SIR2 family protein deacetylase
VRIVKDLVGAVWEKRGNTSWLECPACRKWFPAGPVMLRADAAAAHCPQCHHEFKPAANAPREGG